MSKYNYEMSKEIAAHDYPFYALIMAAMRQADTDNLELLKASWPGVYDELLRRYNAPDGVLPEEETEDELGNIPPSGMDEYGSLE